MGVQLSQGLKEIATNLSQILSQNEVDNTKVQSLLAMLGYKSGSNGSGEFPEFSSLNQNIGIYKPEIINDELHYVRDPALKDAWDFSADVPTIFPKKRKRIILLGESVARGFLLDPYLTPSMVIEKIFSENSLSDEFEILDLAETNIKMELLKERYLQCFSLHPDMIVFFAGNNWRSSLIEQLLKNKIYVAKLIKTLESSDTMHEVKLILEGFFEELIISFLTYIQHNNRRKIPILFVLPEYNLMNSRCSPGEQYFTKLTGDGMSKWISTFKATKEALAKSDYKTGEKLATLMIEIDPSHPMGFELLADFKLLQNEYDEARKCLECARDTALFCRTGSTPRIFNVIRNALTERARTHDVHILDLSLVFKNYQNGRLPGKELFLDYCHLTETGINVASEAICKTIFNILLIDIPKNLKVPFVKVDDSVKAFSHFFAAIHNAHWGQPYEILYYHCIEAVNSSRQVVQAMILYIEIMCRRAPNNLCSALEQLLSCNKLDRCVHALIHPPKNKILEIDLIKAMTDALRTVGVEVEHRINEIRLKEHFLSQQEINLLLAPYCCTCYDMYLGTKVLFYEARTNESDFLLIASKDHQIQLKITLRIPEDHGVSKVGLRVNNCNIAELQASRAWQNYSITIPSEVIESGINNIRISWPIPNYVEKEKLIMSSCSPLEMLSLLLDKKFYVFGSIFAFNCLRIESSK